MECTRVNAWLSKMPLWKFALSLSLVFVLSWSPFLFGEIGKTDEGFALTAYQQLFEHPQSAEGQTLYYNGILLGAIWNYIWGGCGVIGFRILGLLLMSLSVIVVCYILNGKVSRFSIVIGVITIVLVGGQLLSRYHDILSGLMAVLASLFLLKSLEHKNPFLILFAGVILGINVFTRFPNLSLVLLSFCLVPFFIYTKDRKTTIQLFFSAVCGFLLGGLLEYVILLLLHHDKMVLEGISNLFSFLNSNTTYSHSPNLLIREYILEFVAIIVVAIPIIIIPLLSIVTKTKMPNLSYAHRLIIYVLLAIGFFFIVWICRQYWDTAPAVIYAFCFSIMITYVLLHYSDSERVYCITAALLIMSCLPLGSDNGYHEMGGFECIVLAMPLSIGLLERIGKEYFPDRHSSRLISIFLLLFVLASSIKDPRSQIWRYRSSQCLSKCESIPQLSYTRMAQYKLRLTEDLLDELQKYVKEKDYLLCWQHCAYIHYLTHTYPYLNNSWVWTYDIDNLLRHIDKSEQNIPYKPVLLCDKGSFYGWTYNPDWDSENATDQKYFPKQKAKIFHKFVADNNYYTVWENEIYRIMLPGKKELIKE